MNTQPHYIKIVLLTCLGLLVFTTCIGAYMLYTMEYDESVSVYATNVPQGQDTPSQNQGSLPADGTMPVVQEGTSTPPLPPALPEDVPTFEEMQARQIEHEAELKATKENPPVPVMDFVTQEEIQRRAQELQNTQPTTPQ